MKVKPVDSQVWNQVDNQVYWQVWNQVKNQVYWQVWDQVKEEERTKR